MSGLGGISSDSAFGYTYFDDYYQNYIPAIQSTPFVSFLTYSPSQINLTVTENNVDFVFNQDPIGGNYYVKVYSDNLFQGVYSSLQPIYKSSTVGKHVFGYELIAADNYLIRTSQIVNISYSVVLTDI